MASDLTTPKEDALESENAGLRELIAQAGIDAARLLAQAGIDATEQKAAERLQRLLLEELHHRVKNTVATVMAITSQTLRSAENLAQGRQAIDSRLLALGRAHDFLLQTNWESANLSDVIRAAIEPYDTKDAGRFMVHDVDIGIDAGMVLSLTMAINELCTNAIKYGALSNETGHIEIKALLDEDLQRFKLTWSEKAGPIVQKPTRRSFGTRLIERLATQLHGNVQWSFEPTGVVCEIDAPLDSLDGAVEKTERGRTSDHASDRRPSS